MPSSLVLYTTKDIYRLFEETLTDTFRDHPTPPYTLSFPQKTQGDMVRLRITEMSDQTMGWIVQELIETKRAVQASHSDPDVKKADYQNLRENADRFNREIRLQFASPTLLQMGSYQVQYPVVPLLFKHYMNIWNAFSPEKITPEPTLLEYVRLINFKISSERTAYGTAFQGWIDLEIAKGRTEHQIAIINLLCDFSFYCGTGLHTDRGLGQTKRAPAREH